MDRPQELDKSETDKPPAPPSVDMSDPDNIRTLKDNRVLALLSTNEMNNAMSEQSDGPHVQKLDLSVAKIIPNNISEKLSKTKDDMRISDNIRVLYDNHFNCYRFIFKDADDSTINLYLNKEKNRIIEMSSTNPEDSRALISDIVQAGGLTKEFLKALNISPQEADKLLKEKKERTQLLADMQTGDLDKLKKSSDYKGNKSNTETVAQGDAVILDLSENKSLQGLYTENASTCSILILTSEKEGKPPEIIGMVHKDRKVPEKIAMAHIDISNMENVAVLLYKMGDAKNLKATVISGKKDIAVPLGRLLNQSGINIKFANINSDGERIDSAIVDRQGNVYYGKRRELYDVRPQKEQEVLERIFSKNLRLHIREAREAK